MSARDTFDSLITNAEAALTGDEILVAHFNGESSDFVRFNGDAVRQAGSVSQQQLDLDLSEGAKHTSGTVTLSGDLEIDTIRVLDLLGELREQRTVVPEDPYLLLADGQPSIEKVTEGSVPDSTAAIDAILSSARGKDLVGIYAAGGTYSGVRTSTGVSHWYEGATFNLDWSFYLDDAARDRAAKNFYAGTTWSDDEFAHKLAWSDQQLAALARPALDLEPGRYRAYLAPAAMSELLRILSWGGFGLKSHRTMSTPLLRMVTDDARLHDQVSITEDIAGGTAAPFQNQGFARPDSVALIGDGTYVGHLVSPRSAQEYGVATNGAVEGEWPVALAMAPGTVPTGAVLDELGTGIYVGNLWYVNYSDRPACRTTGMTRFATFWVADGEIVAPINVLRYDDSTYNLLGDHLIGLTNTAETILDPSTYKQRSTESQRVPGAVIEEMTFTL